MAIRDLKDCTFYLRDGSNPVNEIEIETGEGTITWEATRNMDYRLSRGKLKDVREGDEVPVSVSITADFQYYTGPATLDDTAIDNVAGYGIGDTTITVDTMADIPAYGRTFTIADETNTPLHTVISATATTITFTPAITSAVADAAVVAFTTPPTIVEALSLSGNASHWVSTDPDLCNPPCVDLVMVYDPGACGDTETTVFNYFRWESNSSDLSEGTLSISGNCNVTLPTHSRA